MATGEVFNWAPLRRRMHSRTPGAYAHASAQANWWSRRGIDLTAGFDLQQRPTRKPEARGVSASFTAGRLGARQQVKVSTRSLANTSHRGTEVVATDNEDRDSGRNYSDAVK